MAEPGGGPEGETVLQMLRREAVYTHILRIGQLNLTVGV